MSRFLLLEILIFLKFPHISNNIYTYTQQSKYFLLCFYLF